LLERTWLFTLRLPTEAPALQTAIRKHIDMARLVIVHYQGYNIHGRSQSPFTLLLGKRKTRFQTPPRRVLQAMNTKMDVHSFYLLSTKALKKFKAPCCEELTSRKFRDDRNSGPSTAQRSRTLRCAILYSLYSHHQSSQHVLGIS
jgi:hypothetical protein